MGTSDKPDNRGKIVIQINPEIKTLIPQYMENRRKNVSAVLLALDNRDFESIQIIGHSMKGSGESYGFFFITQLGIQMEQAAKEKATEKIHNILADLTDFLDRLEVRFE